MPPSGALLYLWALLWSKVWSLPLRKCFQKTGEVFICVDLNWIIFCVYIDHLWFTINILLSNSVILVLRLVTGNVSMRVSAFWYAEHRAWGYIAIRWENMLSFTIQQVLFQLFFIFYDQESALCFWHWMSERLLTWQIIILLVIYFSALSQNVGVLTSMLHCVWGNMPFKIILPKMFQC